MGIFMGYVSLPEGNINPFSINGLRSVVSSLSLKKKQNNLQEVNWGNQQPHDTQPTMLYCQ